MNRSKLLEDDNLTKAFALFDVDGNIINVNSWIECAHYVNGGWNSAYYSGIKSELIFLSITIFYSFGYFVYKKRRSIKNVNKK